MTDSASTFIKAQTAPSAPPLVPEIRLYLASEITPLWQATEATLRAANLPPPLRTLRRSSRTPLKRTARTVLLVIHPSLGTGRLHV